MKMLRFFLMIFLSLIPFCFLCVPALRAQDSWEEEFRQMKAQFEVMQKRMAELEVKVGGQEEQIAEYETQRQVSEKRIQYLEDRLAQSPSAAPASGDRNPLAKWTPEIGVIADTLFLLDSSKVDGEGADRVSVRELELVFGAAVDPYSRLDATIAFSDFEEPSLEEAYLTRFGLPVDITMRFGKFKPKVGKAISLHRDSLETVDEPLVIQRYFGVEGLNKSGIDFSKTLEANWPVTHQATFGLIDGGNGEDGTAFGESRRRPTLYSHLKNYMDLTPETGLELGFSHMIGSRDEDSRFEVQVLGADGTLMHNFSANQKLKILGEVFNLTRKETESFDDNLWGSYALADMRFHPQWSTGFRYDYVEPVDNDRSVNPQKDERGYTGYLTFHQSEFARWRLQAAHTDLVTGQDDNRIMLQGTFAIGEHKHKIQ